MTWAWVGVGAATVLGAAMSSDASNDASASAAKQQNNAAYKNYTNAVKQIEENNTAIGEANTTNMIRAGYKVGLINLQTAHLKEQAALQGYAASKAGMEALSTTEANAAAAGTVGASVNAAANDIKKKSEEAQIGVQETWKDTLENQNFAVQQLTQQAYDSMTSVQHVPDISTVNTVTNYNTSAWTGAATSLLSMYAGSQVNMGGSTAQTTGQSYSFTTGMSATSSQYSSSTLGGVYGSYRTIY